MTQFDGDTFVPKPGGGFSSIKAASLRNVGAVEAGMILHTVLNRLFHRLGRNGRLDAENAKRLAAVLTSAHLKDVDFIEPLERLELMAELAMRSGIGMDDIAAAMTRVALRRGATS